MLEHPGQHLLLRAWVPPKLAGVTRDLTVRWAFSDDQRCWVSWACALHPPPV